MSEVVTNDREVDAGLQECDGTAVAENVGADAPPAEPRMVNGRAIDVLREQIGRTIAGEGAPDRAAKHDSTLRTVSLDQALKGRRRLRPERTDALLRALAANADMPWRRQAKIIGPHAERLADPRPRIVEEEQQCVVARTGWTAAIGLSEKDLDVLWLEVLDETLVCPLGRDRKDAAVLLRT